MLKRFLSHCLLIATVLCLTISAYAHPGRTDGNGGHTDQSTGEYHYHHGYPAHDHWDMDGDGDIDCPYKFNDKTNHSSGNSGTGSSNSSNSKPSGVKANQEEDTDSTALYWAIGITVLCLIIFKPLDGLKTK